MLLKCRTNADRYSSAGAGGLCVGTRQALLQGWLLCVGFVCLANVPDLVRWVVSAKSWMLKCCRMSFRVTYNDRALCRCGISIPSARNRCRAFDKDKCLEPMFGDVGQAPNQSSDMQNCRLLQPQAAFAQNPLLPAVIQIL